MKDVRSRKCCIYDNWPFFFSEKVCSRISKLLTGLNREKLRLNYLLISLPIVLFLEKKVKDILKGIKCVSENKTKVSKTRKIPEFLLNESIESGLGWIGNSLNSSIKISWNSSLIIYFFFNYLKCVNFSGSKGPFSKYLFYSRFDEAFYRALRLAVAGSSRGIKNERYSSPQ